MRKQNESKELRMNITESWAKELRDFLFGIREAGEGPEIF